MIFLQRLLDAVQGFFVIYLIGYASFLFLSVVVGGTRLYKRKQMLQIRNELKHDYYMPISILVPAYNEEVTIVDSIESLLQLNYRLYEIIIVDDGSKDATTEVLLEHFPFEIVERPIHKRIDCRKEQAIYECTVNGIHLTLVQKENGGKGDALNMGINASSYPYFLCIDADSMLQKDSLERIVQPLLENDEVIAVAGLVRVAQCVEIENGEVKNYHLPWNPILCMQVMEYDRSFLASRILMDYYNGNIIISGAFGLFRKDIVIAAGGYDRDTLGEDMELAVKLHVFARNNQLDYSIRYESNAVCWSQAPSSIKDLMKQRRRWHLGLFQCMTKYSSMFMNTRFGLVSFLSYMYYLFYELLSPFIEFIGLAAVVLSIVFGFINVSFMIFFFLFYALYGSLLTLTAFFQRVYAQDLKLGFTDLIKAIIMCFLENVFFRFLLTFARTTAFFHYKKRKREWGSIKREKQRTG